MSNNNVFDIKKPEPFLDDQITTIIRQGARRLLAQALEAEIDLFISQYAELLDEAGRQRVVRNGYRPEREIQLGIGAVPVKAKCPGASCCLILKAAVLKLDRSWLSETVPWASGKR